MPAVDFETILDGLGKIAELHPDPTAGSIALTNHLEQFEGYDAEGFAAGVCFVKDLMASVSKQASLLKDFDPQALFAAYGNCLGWAATVAITMVQLEEVGEEE